MKSTRLLIGVLLVLSVIFFLIASPAGNANQDQDRLIENRSKSARLDEPVVITTIMNKKGEINAGEKFKGDDDWVKGLTVRVKNISGKNISYIDIRFSFERPEKHETSNNPPLVHSLTYGTSAKSNINSARILAPGQEVDISLPDTTYEALQRALSKLKYSSIKRLHIYLAEVIFDDGTAWNFGVWFRRDPNDPEKWIPVDQQIIANKNSIKRPPANGGRFKRSEYMTFWRASWKEMTNSVAQSSQCGQPGAPYYETCVGASNADCRKKEQKVYTFNRPDNLTPVLS